MANFKNKRSSRSGKRGKGKNHSVNKEKSREESKKRAKTRRLIAINTEIARRIKVITRAYWSGKYPDWKTAVKATKQGRIER